MNKEDDIGRALAEEIKGILEEAMAADRVAVTNLLNTRVVCSDALADHPAIQTGMDNEGRPVVGLLGLVNGVLAKHDLRLFADGETVPTPEGGIAYLKVDGFTIL